MIIYRPILLVLWLPKLSAYVLKRGTVVVVYECFNDQQRVGLDLTYFSICFHL